jgi:hypothetical protein
MVWYIVKHRTNLPSLLWLCVNVLEIKVVETCSITEALTV